MNNYIKKMGAKRETPVAPTQKDAEGQMESTPRYDRSHADRADLLSEISNAEAILDGMKAKPGLTLWGRIASIKELNKDLLDALGEVEDGAIVHNRQEHGITNYAMNKVRKALDRAEGRQ